MTPFLETGAHERLANSSITASVSASMATAPPMTPFWKRRVRAHERLAQLVLRLSASASTASAPTKMPYRAIACSPLGPPADAVRLTYLLATGSDFH